MRRAHQFARCERGTAAIDFAFIAIPLIVGTVGVIEVGRAMFMANELAHAADRAARAVMLQFDITQADLTDTVRDEDFLTGLAPATITVQIDSGAGATFRVVQLSYPFTPMITGFTVGSVTLRADRRIAK